MKYKTWLKNYWLNIILIILLAALSFWFNPRQQDLYLKADFELLEKKSTRVLLWTMSILTIVILAITVKGVKKIGEVGSVLLGIVALSFPIYIFFKTIFLSGSLALNRIELSDHYEKKYTITFLMETDKQTPVLYDFRTRKTLFFEKVRKIEKLKSLEIGDTVIISFRKGLLGVPFSPVVK